MQTPAVATTRIVRPKRRQRHYSYDENVNEAAALIEDEPVEIEHEVPAENSLSEQSVEPDDKPPYPPFED